MRKGPREPRPVTPAVLERSALFRLKRASLSERQLRDGLKRKLRREEHPFDAESSGWIDEVVAKMARLGFIDDERTAAARASSLRAVGTSRRGSLAKLRLKGIDPEVAERALAHVDGEEGASAELSAAREYARRRRLADKDPQKALAALARRGFSLSIARRALAPDEEQD